MRVLHIVKTADGAVWAAQQAKVLASKGVDVHVAIPSLSGEAVRLWKGEGIQLHQAELGLPLKAPHRFRERSVEVRQLVDQVKPDLIHSHFVTTTLMIRLALRRRSSPPRLFQVPGPLHLEHKLYRLLDLVSATSCDSWIASSDYTRRLYLAAKVDPGKIFLSYYGSDLKSFASAPTGELRRWLKIPENVRIIGNISYMYPPKYYLGQTSGIKGHEQLIDAIGMVCSRRSDVRGVLAGGQWGKGTRYFERLSARARAVAGDRIALPGRVPQGSARHLWADFDCVLHAPRSENCGGVVEPLASGVPTVAARVGGLPEVVIDGQTGWMVEPGNTEALADAALDALDNSAEGRRRATLGHRLVHHMFDVERTADEVLRIYRYALGIDATGPSAFNPAQFLASLL